MARWRLQHERAHSRDSRSSSLLTVACVLSPGPTYTEEHVERLRQQVKAHLSPPYRFVCLTDSPFPGWWSKISLFEPGRFSGRVLYFDLDVSIVGGIDKLALFNAPFVICKDWNLPGFNSSVMSWEAGKADHLFTRFHVAVMDHYRGDQDWIYHRMPFAATFPEGWCYSYKKGLKTGHPDGMSVCVFHGRPKSWELPDGHPLK